MHCICCNALLTDAEATTYDEKTQSFVDICGECTTPVDESDDDLMDVMETSGIIEYIGIDTYLED